MKPTVLFICTGNAVRSQMWDILDPAKAEGTEEEILHSFREARDQLKGNSKAWPAEQKALGV